MCLANALITPSISLIVKHWTSSTKFVSSCQSIWNETISVKIFSSPVYLFCLANPFAISTNSSFVKLGKFIFWNLERNPTPNSCLLFAKAPLLGFWVAIIPKFGCILYFWNIK